jgi:hypothetical protein
MTKRKHPKVGKVTATLHTLAIEAQHLERYKAMHPRLAPTNTRRIDPNSPEGKAIAAKYAR